MGTLTASIERDGKTVVHLLERDDGAFLMCSKWPIELNAVELRHVATLATEMAVNAEKRALTRDRDLPAVGSFGGC